MYICSVKAHCRLSMCHSHMPYAHACLKLCCMYIWSHKGYKHLGHKSKIQIKNKSYYMVEHIIRSIIRSGLHNLQHQSETFAVQDHRGSAWLLLNSTPIKTPVQISVHSPDHEPTSRVQSPGFAPTHVYIVSTSSV